MSTWFRFVSSFCLSTCLATNLNRMRYIDKNHCRTQSESSKFTFCSGLVLHKNQARSTFGDWLNGIIEFSRSLHSMELDVSAFSCLAALTLVNGESQSESYLDISSRLPVSHRRVVSCSLYYSDVIQVVVVEHIEKTIIIRSHGVLRFLASCPGCCLD